MIKDEDISIVVQGPILKSSKEGHIKEITRIVCTRLKELLPKAELILSTWEGENVDRIPHDLVIYNVDPGATWFNYENYNLLNNCNRLIISTYAGIKAASRKYVFKIRSDLFLCSKSFLHYFYTFPLFDDSLKFVKNRIIGFSIYSIKGHKTSLFTMERPYHISDWAYFGYKEDLLALYDIDLTKEPEFSQWFLTRNKPFFDIEPHRLWKMPPEQYITSSFLSKYTKLQFQHTADNSNNNMLHSAKLLVNNFLILDQTQFSLISLKYINFQLLFEPLLSYTAIFYSTWLKDYLRYTQPISRALYLKYCLIIIIRQITYRLMNLFLRLINRKKIVQKFALYWIKKLYKKAEFTLTREQKDPNYSSN